MKKCFCESECTPTKPTHECQIEGCDLDWTHYLHTSIGVLEVCKKHAYQIMEERAKMCEEVGMQCDFEMFTKKEVEHL